MQYLFMEMVLELELLTIASTARKILFAITLIYLIKVTS